MILLVIIMLEVSYLVYLTSRSKMRSKNTSMYVDTSVLIDGRILDIAKTGFITADLIIPRSVIAELQILADNGDTDKRAKARNGLDLAQKLKSLEQVNVVIFQDNHITGNGVDDRLLNLAKKYGGMICTIDYNLNKVAQVEGVPVVNVNELAKNVRFTRLPGDVLTLELVQKGQDAHQGVGYLDDGTMVVVENASKYVGRNVKVEVTRAIQTDAGRMMFAKPISVATNKAKPTTKKTKPSSSTKSAKPETKSQTQGRRRSSKSSKNSSNEDRLIDLVNNQ